MKKATVKLLTKFFISGEFQALREELLERVNKLRESYINVKIDKDNLIELARIKGQLEAYKYMLEELPRDVETMRKKSK